MKDAAQTEIGTQLRAFVRTNPRVVCVATALPADWAVGPAGQCRDPLQSWTHNTLLRVTEVGGFSWTGIFLGICWLMSQLIRGSSNLHSTNNEMHAGKFRS